MVTPDLIHLMYISSATSWPTEEDHGDTPPGFIDVFNEELGKVLALGNSSAAIKMLMSFARSKA